MAFNPDIHFASADCQQWHCTIHQRDEPTEGYRLCAECGHMFGTPEELIAETFRLDTVAYIEGWTKNPPREQDPEKIHACPHCTHDF